MCVCHVFAYFVFPCQADDIYIMMKCLYVCVCVTFLLIFPSPCQADDIYIMMKCMCVCVCVTFLLILSSPCQADDIYIMMKCMCVCLCVTFLLILPSPCQADDIYIMMKCLSVCHVFACPNCQIAAPVGSHCAHLPLCIANNWKFIMIIMNVDVMMMMIDFKVPIYVDQIWNSSCLSVCFSQNYYFPPSWAP